MEGERKLFTGGAADYAGDIRAMVDIGVTAFDFGLFAPTLGATIDNLRKFKDEVMAKECGNGSHPLPTLPRSAGGSPVHTHSRAAGEGWGRGCWNGEILIWKSVSTLPPPAP